MRKSEGLLRVALGFLAVSGAVVGVWAQFAPRSFYDDFPGAGRRWVGVLGQFNEHLVRDVGGLNLALTVLTLAAAVSLAVALVRVAAVAWLVYSVPHLVYHLAHLDPLPATDQVLQSISLALLVVVPVVVLAISLRR